MSEKPEDDEFDDEEDDEPVAEDGDVDLDQVTKDLDLAKRRGAKAGDRPGLIPVQSPGDRSRGDRAGELGDDVARSVGLWEVPVDGQPEGHRGVEVGPRDVADAGDSDG